MSAKDRKQEKWARLRFLVIGRLLSDPPKHGELSTEIARLATMTWCHPIKEEPCQFSPSTIEAWYYAAQRCDDPVLALQRKLRKDAGSCPSLSSRLQAAILDQYKSHPSWSVQLHFDNLSVLVEEEPALGSLPSYSTVLRHMRRTGLRKRRRAGSARRTAGALQAEARLARLEVRSYECEYTNGLWHLDFHHGSRKVLLKDGSWVKPLLLGVLDDHSRLCCHVQWYLNEQAESLVHGLSQAIQKRGLPRSLMTDNGSAMRSLEVQRGLSSLGIVHELTLPYSPYQNAKQEVFWAVVEGRLMAMLEDVSELSLDLLNEATQAWSELDYNHKVHSEIGAAPMERFLNDKDVGRKSPSTEDLRGAFRQEQTRSHRRSDGTVGVLGRRFEVPSRFRHLERLRVRYASWDLRRVDLVDERTGAVVCALYPQDKVKNASGVRRLLDPAGEPLDLNDSALAQKGDVAPLMRKLLMEYGATGLPPAYLPMPEERADERQED